MIRVKGTSSLAAVILLLFFLAILPMAAVGQTSQATASGVTDIQLSYKRDSRQVDPFRGIGPWATGPNYIGATAQDTVETVARAVDAKGQPMRVSLEWIPSDPEMVTVAPSQGDHVKITVHKVGESQLKISAQGFSKELLVKATSAGKFIVFQISQPEPPKPNGPAAMEMSPALKDHKAQISYAAGMRMAKTLRKQSVEVDPDLVKQAIQDVTSGGITLMTDEQVQATLMGVETELNVTEASLERKRVAEKNKQLGEQFLAENKKKDGIMTLPSGLQYRVLKAGDGKKPTILDAVVCQYKGSLLDGSEFDNSYKRKDGKPVTFPVRGVIRGWQEALKLMPTGSKWQLFVPADLAYGERGMPMAKIPPSSTLVFEVELLAVKEPAQKGSQVAASPETTVTPQQLDAVEKAIQAAKKESEKEAEPEREKNQ
jgi:FKBP-type peptidyl-prolyl cis-trans isomerase FklB